MRIGPWLELCDDPWEMLPPWWPLDERTAMGDESPWSRSEPLSGSSALDDEKLSRPGRSTTTKPHYKIFTDIWGTWPIFIDIAIRKSSKNDEEKSKAAPRYYQPIARKSRSKLPVTESVNFAEFHGFYDVKGNYELDFRAIGWLYYQKKTSSPATT